MPLRRKSIPPSPQVAPDVTALLASPEVAPVFASLRRLIAAMHTSSRHTEQHLGLTAAQLFVLTQLRATPSLSINELAERTMTHQSTVSVVVRRLVQRKLVRKARATSDARRVELTLAPAGAALLRKAPEAMQVRLARAIESLPAGDRQALAGGLGHLVMLLGIEDEPETMFFEHSAPGDAGE